ncbi:MAG: hypothetical protein HRT66_00285, partial [Flavobacteriaceae bacterium]|nr:hypothetical protein [Flavobacteriaceae bacterium]
MKVLYVKLKFDMMPYTYKTIILVMFLVLISFVFENINIIDNSFINIIVKSIIVSSIYIVFVLSFKISPQINGVFIKNIEKIKKKIKN